MVNEIEVLNKINSTQIYAKNFVNQNYNFEHNRLILANEQTAGYGRRGRDFFSPRKTGLYFSLVLKNSSESLNDLGLLMTGISMALVRSLCHFYPGKNFQLKWVNDVYLDNKKVAGILTESITEMESNTSRALIIGVGVNLSTINFPDGLETKVKSIDENYKINRNLLVASIIDEINNIINAKSKNSFLKEYRERLLLMNRKVLLKVGNQDFSGQVLDIDEKGQLVLQLDNDEIKHFNTGEVIKVNF